MSALLAEVHVEEGTVRLEPRVARIESDVASLKETVEKLDAKVERLDRKLDARFEKLDERFERVDERFEKVDEKINHLGARMAFMESEFGNLKENQARFAVDLGDLRRSLDAKFMWIVTTMIAFGTALLAAMAEGFHWLK